MSATVDDIWYSCNFSDAALADPALGRIEAQASALFFSPGSADAGGCGATSLC